MIHNKKEIGDVDQRVVWDAISKSWKKSRELPVPVVADFLKNKKGKVIDFGCGAGRNLIKNDKITYTAIDFSIGQLRYAKEKTKKEDIKANFIKSDLTKTKLANNEFDYGLFMATLHCLETEQTRIASLKEFYRILKKNAEALISVWNTNNPRFKDFDKDIYAEWEIDDKKYLRFYHLYDKDELIKLLESVGFKVLEIYEQEYKYPGKKFYDRFVRRNIIVRIKK